QAGGGGGIGLAAGGDGKQPPRESERADHQHDAGGTVQDRHEHGDLPAVHLEVRRQGAVGMGHRGRRLLLGGGSAALAYEGLAVAASGGSASEIDAASVLLPVAV